MMVELSVVQVFLLCILLGAGLLAVSGRLRNDLIALLVLFLLAISGVVSPTEAFRGFSSPAVITLAGLFVVTAAMNQAGFVHWVAERLEKVTGDSEIRMVLSFMVVGGALSLVVNTAAAGAVLLPAVVSLAKKKGISTSRILMPMGFGVIVGGTATIFTTANIIMSGLLQGMGGHGLTMLDFLPTGGALFLVTVIYMLTLGRRLLTAKESRERRVLNADDLAGVYAMEQRLWELKVLADSPLAHKTLAEAQLGFPVLAIWRDKHANFEPAADDRLEPGDILLVSSSRERLDGFRKLHLQVGRGRQFGERGIPVVIVETVIPPRSKSIGQSLIDLDFQKRHGLTVVALWRGGTSHRRDVGSMKLQAGDALLVVGSLTKVMRLTDNPDYLVVDTPAYQPMSRVQSGLTLTVSVSVLAAAGLGLLSMSLAAFSGALLLVLLRIIPVERAYASIDWSILVLIAGMFPLATAMEKTGLTSFFSKSFATNIGGDQALLAVAALYLFTVLMTLIVGGQVSALFTGPVALSIASAQNIDMTAMAVLVGVACSNCFLTSIAHPVNLLVSGPGGYTGSDFVKVGAGLHLVCFVVAMVMAHFYWGI